MIHSKTLPAPQTCMSGVLSTHTRLPGFHFIVVCTNIENYKIFLILICLLFQFMQSYSYAHTIENMLFLSSQAG